MLAALILAINLGGIGAGSTGSSLLVIVARTSAVSGLSAIVILLSVGLGCPVTSDFLKPCMTSGSAAKTAAWNRLSAACPRFRHQETRLGVMWGGALLADSYARLICAFTLPPAIMARLFAILNVAAVAVALAAGSAAVRPIRKMISSEVADEPGQRGADGVHALIPVVDKIGRGGGLRDNEKHHEDDDPESDDAS
jgi:hypothetical protein